MPRLKILTPFVALIAIGLGAGAVPAAASTSQDALFQDGPLLRADPIGTLATLKSLGVSKLRLLMAWNSVAPSAFSHRRPNFKSTNPSSYSAAKWAIYDTILKTAKADGITVDLDLVGPAPLWATGAGAPGGPAGVWKPSASEFGAFVRAVGTRYSGNFKGLPRVSFWTVWNEPNYGPSLAPQARAGDTIQLSPGSYRSLVDAAYSSLQVSGHGPDRFVIGETAPHGFDHPIGNFGGMKPVPWVESLYCVGSSFRQFRGSAAAARGCPTTAAGSRSFAARNPGLFKAGGFAVHPYAQGIAPNQPSRLCGNRLCPSGGGGDPGFADLPVLPRFERILDRLQGIYGSRNHMGIWSTEYGYQTTPPSPKNAISPAKAAVWINWAEYLSYKQPRIQSYGQYLLRDVAGSAFASGLELPNGSLKPTYAAYRMPIYLPTTSTRRGRSIEVWGCVRPAHTMSGTQQVKIQFGKPGSFQTVKTVAITNSRGYFDVKMSFTGSGFVRTSWTPPGGATVTSRLVHLTVR
jgi:hypothetical protein